MLLVHCNPTLKASCRDAAGTLQSYMPRSFRGPCLYAHMLACSYASMLAPKFMTKVSAYKNTHMHAGDARIRDRTIFFSALLQVLPHQLRHFLDLLLGACQPFRLHMYA
jgi:hypothetical protein